ncbi:MAG: isocitrate/isopropylmalate family dehydrogenase [Thermodesulfobacteriota bacterium]|nr:MAG: isocitrate/isopropylmalate family dehydrogenase [Thermodesulfobacteriota bacterium]
MSKRKVVLIPGDGIGPNISTAVKKVVAASGAEIRWIGCKAGLAALEEGPDVLPESTIDAIKEHKIALKGPCTTPIGEGFTSVNVQLRKILDLYSAIRPIRNLDGIKTRFSGVDIVIIRENTEGLYSGVENQVTPGVVMTMKVATEDACYRIAKKAFEYARKRGRKKVTVFHKANIMKMTDGLFIRKSREVSQRYTDIEYEEMIIDAGCMKIVQDPTQFDILLLENLYGDLLSDLCAGLVGGLGVVPGSNIGDDIAVFEAVHGSAPDIAGKNIANPLALLMSCVMMLNHLAENEGIDYYSECATKIKLAYNKAIGEGATTRDLGGNLGTQEFADALIERM